MVSEGRFDEGRSNIPDEGIATHDDDSKTEERGLRGEGSAQGEVGGCVSLGGGVGAEDGGGRVSDQEQR